MQAVEALQTLILETDKRVAFRREVDPASIEEGGEKHEWYEHTTLAVAVAQAMLNTAIPVARFRAFVEVDDEQPKRTAAERERAIFAEFTICGTTINSIRSGLIGLSQVKTNCRVLIFEQRATGADMVTAFQGTSKTQQYRDFLKSLSGLEAPATVQ